MCLMAFVLGSFQGQEDPHGLCSDRNILKLLVSTPCCVQIYDGIKNLRGRMFKNSAVLFHIAGRFSRFASLCKTVETWPRQCAKKRVGTKPLGREA